jgi:sialate O-acetylesterase
MKLASVFSDHAVLQRGQRVPVWGWTRPRLRVRVTLGSAAGETIAGADGRFLTWLPALSAGGPFTLEVNTPDDTERAVVNDVAVGEVWLCSGQSNMEWPLGNTGLDGEREVAAADHPLLRMIRVPRLALAGRQSDVNAAWQVCTPRTAGAFTAVGYHVARALQQRLGVAVGLIDASWGGTRIEAWISRESLVEDPVLRLEVERDEATCHSPAFWAEVDPYDVTDPVQRAAYEQTKTNYPADPGNEGLGKGWARAAFDDAAWPVMSLPTSWQNAGHPYSAVVWFRRAVEVPPEWAGCDLLLGIGAVDKQDITYFNGEQVGATGKGFEREHWSVPRTYRIPGKLVKAGRNMVAVRAYSFMNHGGLTGPADQMSLAPAVGGGAALHLAGDWRFAVEHNFGLVTAATLSPGPGNPQTAGILFDNLIAPMTPYGIRGVLWYQGESNCDAFCAPRYGGMLARLIRDWRHAWGQGDFQFLTVQLANYLAARPYQENSTWARVREGQAQTLALPATGVAVAIDIGDAADIHPRNKRDVGRRLAQWALTQLHGVAGVPCGPLFDGATIEPRGIRVRFRHIGGGLQARGGALHTFAIAGSNRVFVPAEATIEGDTVLISSPQVPLPVAVRYAWADNPDGANLYNGEGFPAFPFRSDAW